MTLGRLGDERERLVNRAATTGHQEAQGDPDDWLMLRRVQGLNRSPWAIAEVVSIVTQFLRPHRPARV